MNGRAYVSTDYTGSTVDHFDLYTPDFANGGDRNRIYYGCILETTSQASKPVSCTITVRGFDAAGRQVAAHDLAFTSLGGLKQPMQGGTFPKEFVGLRRVEFSVSKTLGVLPTFVLMDNLVTRVYQKKT